MTDFKFGIICSTVDNVSGFEQRLSAGARGKDEAAVNDEWSHVKLVTPDLVTSGPLAKTARLHRIYVGERRARLRRAIREGRHTQPSDVLNMQRLSSPNSYACRMRAPLV